MAWTTVTWSNLDLITETKLDGMTGNDDYLRDELRVRSVLTNPEAIVQVIFIGGMNFNAEMKLVLTLGATSYRSNLTNSTSYIDAAGTAIKNIDISALADNAVQHIYLSVDANTGAGQPFLNQGTIARATFFKTPDMNYFSLWAMLRRTVDTVNSEMTAYVLGATCIVSRDNEGF